MSTWLKITLLVLLAFLIIGGSAVAGYFIPSCQDEGTGQISISSTPRGAKIYLDGKNTGHLTPYTLDDVSVGSHIVKLTKSGYKDRTKTVKVEKKKDVKVSTKLVKKKDTTEEDVEDFSGSDSSETTDEEDYNGGEEDREDRISISVPSQTSPEDGTEYGRVSTINLRCSTVEGVNLFYGFEAEFKESEGGEWNRILRTIGTKTKATLIVDPEYGGGSGSYRWKVWAQDNVGNKSDNSSWWYLYITR